MKGSRSSRRVAAYAAIDSERDYQSERWKDAPNGGDASLHEFALYISHHSAELRSTASRGFDSQNTLDQVRKVAALAVAALELHGAPHREGFERFEECEEIDLALMGTWFQG